MISNPFLNNFTSGSTSLKNLYKKTYLSPDLSSNVWQSSKLNQSLNFFASGFH